MVGFLARNMSVPRMKGDRDLDMKQSDQLRPKG
jgi:hypothetical protein